jgi:hypothetical protein
MHKVKSFFFVVKKLKPLYFEQNSCIVFLFLGSCVHIFTGYLLPFAKTLVFVRNVSHFIFIFFTVNNSSLCFCLAGVTVAFD